MFELAFLVDSLGLCPADGKELAVRALGAVTYYLKRCCLEQQLLSMCRFEAYDPEEMDGKNVPTKTDNTALGRHMVGKQNRNSSHGRFGPRDLGLMLK